jgi:hypothetical protein
MEKVLGFARVQAFDEDARFDDDYSMSTEDC